MYICLCCLYGISFIRALTASDIEIIKQVSILCRSKKEKLRDAINSQFYIFLQSWLSFAAVLCRAPCFEGPILIFCLLLPATVCSLMFKAIASSICFTPTIGMLVPVFWILLCCVIIAKWPSLYFRHAWKVQEMCVATSRHFRVKTSNGEGVSLTILLPNGQRVRLQVHHSATIGNILQILHEYSDGYHISDTVLCLHDAGRTLAARPLQEAHMRLSSFLPTPTGNFKACLRASRRKAEATTRKCCCECGWSSTEVDADQEIFCPNCCCKCVAGPVHIPTMATCTHCMRDTQLCMHGPRSKFCSACSSPMIVQQTQFVFCDPIEHQTFHQAFQDVKWTTCTLPGGKSIDALIDYENPIWVC